MNSPRFLVRLSETEPGSRLVAPLLVAAAIGGSFYAGQAATSDDRLVVLLAAATGGLVAATLAARLAGLLLFTLGFLLAGYALFDRGFAYLGVSPLYVGEVGLLIAMATLVLGRKERPIAGGLTILLLAFMGLGLARALPYFATYELNTARDSVIWLYGVFALTLSVVMKAEHFGALVALFRRLTVPFLIIAPILVLLPRISDRVLATWPRSNAAILDYKGGDYAVHVAGVAAFILLGLWSSTTNGRERNVWLIWCLWLPGLAISLLGRSSLLTVLLATAAAVALSRLLVASRPIAAGGGEQPAVAGRRDALLPLAVLSLMMLGAALILTPNIDLGARSISLEQLQQNFTSIYSSQDASTDRILRANRNFRTDWWGTIVDYTFGGSRFWTGKGFGVNLAASDGFITDQTLTLRSPHSIHFNILGRMGVPGLALWLLLQGAFAFALFRAFLRMRLRHDLFWARINAWLLVYWLAFMINASFDVYLEGPQGGIWFWCVFGFGLAALRIQAEESHAAAPSASTASSLAGPARAYPARP